MISQASNPVFVVPDASVIIALCAEEPDRVAIAEAALQQYLQENCTLYAPHALVMEALFVLCKKLQNALLTSAQHVAAVDSLQNVLRIIKPPQEGDAALIARAEELRQGYVCNRSADGLYIALAEALALQEPTELLTFDVDQQKQAISRAPTITVNLLVP